MTVNELPEWVPQFNLVVSLAALGLAVLLLLAKRVPVLAAGAIIAACTVLVAGAAFQANFLSLELWVLLGSGGRLATVAFLALLLALQWSRRRRHPHDD